MLKLTKIKYKPMHLYGEDKNYISILYDDTLANNSIQFHLKQYLKYKYPNKRIIFKLNNSIQKLIRCKDNNYQL